MLNLSEIIQLKEQLHEKYDAELHYHDVCPKPFFTMEQTSAEIQSCITAFLESKRCVPRFSNDGLQFTVEKG